MPLRPSPFGNAIVYDAAGQSAPPNAGEPPQTSFPMGLSPEMIMQLLTRIAPPKPAPPQTGLPTVMAVRG